MRNTIIYLIVSFAFPAAILSQTSTENFAQLQFNFNNPGARSAGMGGAFISIADDATAAEANPAGLTTLIKPEVSFEFKVIQYSRTISIFDDNAAGTEYISRDFDKTVVSPSFASLVYPFKKVTFSAFRHELVNYESSFFTREAFLEDFPNGQLLPTQSDMEMAVTNWGGAVGLQFNEKASIGASFGLSQFNIVSRVVRTANPSFAFYIDDSDSDVFFNLGVMLKPHERFSLGGIFKKRPSFSVMQGFEQPPGTSIESQAINFNIPSAFGFGAAYRPSDVLTMSFDLVRITYSDLTADFVVTEAGNFVMADEFSAEDGTEVHFGAEYVTFLGTTGLVFRGGIFSEPDNSIRFTGEANGDVNRQGKRLSFQEGDASLHVTFGAGILTQGNIQVDLAGDISERRNEFVASFVYRL